MRARSRKTGPRVLPRATLACGAVLGCLVSRLAGGAGGAGVPPPDEMPAEVVVSGRTSTAVDIKIVKVGQRIPRLLPRQQGKVANTPGFEWYVSRHFALKSQMPEKFSRYMLEVAELAYPHSVEIAGFEPEGLEEARMAIVYAKTRKDVDRSVRSDIGSFWQGSGGGVTLHANRVAYNYPSGSLMYHKRDLMMHENLHMHVMNTEMGSSPAFGEFITIAGANHVYDEKKKQLTMYVMDKATTNNPYDADLSRVREELPDIKDVMTTSGKTCKMLGLQFFLTDPDRLMKWRLWRDESVERKDHAQLLEEICGPLQRLNDEWKRWAAMRRNTFHYVDWGWEQDGNTLWSYGWPQRGPFSRTDVNMPPGEKPVYDPLVMDYPAEPKPEIAGPVARGVGEPSIGCVLDFSRNPGRGMAGIGLGVIGGAATLSFPEGSLFTDRSATKPGLDVVAYRLGKVSGGGARSEDVANGRLVARSVDAKVALGLGGSAAKGLKESFIVEWKGFLRLAASGPCVLATSSDDGSWLWVDGKRVVSNGGAHGIQMKTGKVTLSRGVHPIRIRYYQGGGGYGMSAGMVTGDMPGYVKVLVKASRELVIDGTDAGLEERTVSIPEKLRAAMKADGHRVGLNVKIADRSLEATLRAGKPDAMEEFGASVPVDVKTRRRLLEKPLSILARDGYHGVTPFFDDLRRMPPDFTVPAPPNRWRFAGLDRLCGLYRASSRLKERTPRSLGRLKDRMLAAVDADGAIQEAALKAHDDGILRVMRDVRRSGAEAAAVHLGLADLTGVSFALGLRQGEAPDEVVLEARARGALTGEVAGNVSFAVTLGPAGDGVASGKIAAASGERVVVRRSCRLAQPHTPTVLTATAVLLWRGERIVLEDTRTCGTSVPGWWIVGPFANKGGWEADIRHPVETEPVDLKKEYTGAAGTPIAWRKTERGGGTPVTAEHLVDLASLFKPKDNVAAYALTWLDAAGPVDAVLAVGSDDGVIVWLNGEKVHANLVGRGYRSKSDLVRMKLREGRNRLLLKITQGTGDWSFCAHLEGREGGVLEGVKASLAGGR